MKYVPTIGVECHVQLCTKTKLFSEVDNDARGRLCSSWHVTTIKRRGDSLGDPGWSCDELRN